MSTIARSRADPRRWWHDAYRTRTVATDFVVVVAVAGAGFLIESQESELHLAFGSRRVDYGIVTALIAVGWFVSLGLGGLWDRRVLGRGSGEFRRLCRATLFFFGAVGVLAYLLKANLARGYVAFVLPAGLLALLVTHAYWRHWLVVRFRDGRLLTGVVVVGEVSGAGYLSRRLHANAQSGFKVIGLCVPEHENAPADSSWPVVGTLDEVADAVHRLGAGAVAVASSDSFGPAQVRELAWELEGTGVRVILSPSLVDVAGPRIHVRPVAGLPLMAVEEPRFSGPKLVTKTAFDVIGAALGLLLLSPALICVAAAIKLQDRGPIFFRQMRVGLGGGTFLMWKFRTMHGDAEDRLKQLRARSEGNRVLFKLRNDPRVTKVGRVLRRFSVDEMPQLLNVLTGDMSLVGPRPPLAVEVAMYDKDVHRRFLVKPGLTGLWQVSGRSDLNWEESVRLDLYYVENWSLAGDLTILAKTARAVMGRSGAY